MMYEFISSFYRRLVPEIFYTGWKCFARPIIQKSRAVRAIKERGERPLCVDAGCGVGVLAGELAAYYDVIGIDISADMLNEAAQTSFNHVMAWVQQDICKMDIGSRKAAAVFATADVLNHVLALSKLNAFFKRAYASLESGGYLFFDVITERTVDYYRYHQCAFEDFEWGSFFWTCKYVEKTDRLVYDISCFEKCSEDSDDNTDGENSDQASADIGSDQEPDMDEIFRIKNELCKRRYKRIKNRKNLANGELYIRTDEHIEERIWQKNILLDCLEKAGFKNVQIYGSVMIPNIESIYGPFSDDTYPRLYFVCEKP